MSMNVNSMDLSQRTELSVATQQDESENRMGHVLSCEQIPPSSSRNMFQQKIINYNFIS